MYSLTHTDVELKVTFFTSTFWRLEIVWSSSFFPFCSYPFWYHLDQSKWEKGHTKLDVSAFMIADALIPKSTSYTTRSLPKRSKFGTYDACKIRRTRAWLPQQPEEYVWVHTRTRKSLRLHLHEERSPNTAITSEDGRMRHVRMWNLRAFRFLLLLQHHSHWQRQCYRRQLKHLFFSISWV